MKYIVVSCCEREISLENICCTYTEAYELMKKCFLNHHLESCRYNEKEIEELRLEIETEFDVHTSKYGFNKDSAWSNVDDDYNYDIKIIEINA